MYAWRKATMTVPGDLKVHDNSKALPACRSDLETPISAKAKRPQFDVGARQNGEGWAALSPEAGVTPGKRLKPRYIKDARANGFRSAEYRVRCVTLLPSQRSRYCAACVLNALFGNRTGYRKVLKPV
jgi:hypothetical protein